VPDDNCPLVYNPAQTDTDSDGAGDECDLCAGFDDNLDADADGVPDGCDVCAGADDRLDADGDNVPDGCDNCPLVANTGQEDATADGIGDACCCAGRVGDVNGSGEDEPTVGDISVLIDHLFISLAPVACAAEADIDQSGGAQPQQGEGGDISVGDISRLIDYLFITGPSLGLADCY